MKLTTDLRIARFARFYVTRSQLNSGVRPHTTFVPGPPLPSYIRLRALAIVPAIYLVGGCLVAYATFETRSLWSPVPGFSVALALVVTATLAIGLVWRGHSLAPVSIAVSGITLLVTLLSLGWLFPLVNASSEPPSLVQRYWYPATLVTIALLTVGAATACWHLLPMRSNER